VAYWRNWLRRSRYQGRYRELVERSALVLKLLVYQPTGALVAAPTTSLPESVGGTRNWDYRYTWIRDAAFTLYALMRLGFTDEAAGFMTWLEARCREAPAGRGLQVLYAIDGNPEVPESVLDHLDGYKGSQPVRVGNSGAGQLQLDIYGELMDSVYLFNKYGRPIGYDLWEALGRQLDWLEKHWQLVKFAGPSDPRFLATLDRIGEELVSDSLVRRYEPDGSDGLPGSEGTFNLCSFWYVEALTRAGRIAEGQYVFEKMLTYANHVGLFAEEIGPAGEALGNFPQAFTHLALISAACNLDRALSGELPPP
jgi:GH15 family glucan-1,4-alpha-glucosidase